MNVTRVLVLEDNAASRRLMAELLDEPRSEETEVSFATTGAQALTIVKRVQFDLAILDLVLPDMDGFEVARRIREMSGDCELIYCSAHNDVERRNRAFSEGAVDYIEKPYDLEPTRQRLNGHIERLNLKKRLIFEKRKLDTMVTTLPVGVVTTDKYLSINTWNLEAEKIFGLVESDALNSSLLDYIHPEYRAYLTRFINDLPLPVENYTHRHSENWTDPIKGLRQDNQLVHLEAAISLWMPGNDMFYTWIIHNVTDRVRLHQELQSAKEGAEDLVAQRTFELVRANKELVQFVDTANAPIFGIDAHGNVNEWNQQAAKITNFTKAEVMGRDLVVDFIASEYKNSVSTVLDKALEGEETANFEFCLLSKSGTRINILLNSSTRRDAMGQVVGVIGVGQDITELERVRIEQEEERKASTAQIIQASKLATLGEMSTSVAHELNQPLNVIRMAASNSRRKISKGTADPKYLNDKLERIEEQTARAAAIIDHMRIFGREAKEAPIPIDPGKMVTNALALVGEQLRLAEIEIMTEFPEDCSLISGHPILIEQVIINLITNARDAMAKKGGESKITLRVTESNKRVHIMSEDTGGGIPEDVMPRIFEPFYTTKEMGEGTGLGLSVSYGIIRDMNGTIIAENTDHGARFTITFPIVS
jgi:PAS domain S-box-containing protein